MRIFTLIGALLVPLLVETATAPASEPELEFTVGDVAYVGRAVAHNDNVCWMAHSDGRLTKLAVSDVTSFRRVGDDFRGMTALEARNQLRGEFGPEWRIVGTGHYLVCTATDRGQAYAQHFEEIYRSFRKYFTQRGFELPEPEFPLIAIVFASEREFIQQCRDDEVGWIPGLLGYYSRSSNRICLFEQGDDFVRVDPRSWTSPFETGLATPVSLRDPQSGSMVGGTGNVDARIEGGFKETIVHEATHQLAFNLGLHSRIGEPPRWMVEGLATMFEAEGTRRNTGSSAALGRINEERFLWFNEFRRQRRTKGSLATFVSLDKVPGANILDFYAESWALTFFLAETRPRQYTEYLRRVADRDPLDGYSPKERLDDFQSVFGQDLSRLELDMLRFIDDLQ